MTEAYQTLDPENMLGYIDALPDDLEKAWWLGHQLPLKVYFGIGAFLLAFGLLVVWWSRR